MAGEGVEYAWAGAKNAYYNLALKDKKGINNFGKSVKSCLSDKVLSIQKIGSLDNDNDVFSLLTMLVILVKQTSKHEMNAISTDLLHWRS